MMYFFCFLAGLIFGGAWVGYHLKRQLTQLAEMIKADEHKKRDPADWWKSDEDD